VRECFEEAGILLALSGGAPLSSPTQRCERRFASTAGRP